MSDRNGMRRPMKQGNELYVVERRTRDVEELSARETESEWPSCEKQRSGETAERCDATSRGIEFNSTITCYSVGETGTDWKVMMGGLDDGGD